VLHELAPISPLDGNDERDRATDRVNVQYPARMIVDADGDSTALTAHLVNLSDDGAAFCVYGRLEPGDVARVIIDAGRAPIVVPVRTVWTRALSGRWLVGVTFDQLTSAQSTAIAKLLSDHAASTTRR
jgi:hypothetical protein